jgi:hypothetical protein
MTSTEPTPESASPSPSSGAERTITDDTPICDFEYRVSGVSGTVSWPKVDGYDAKDGAQACLRDSCREVLDALTFRCVSDYQCGHPKDFVGLFAYLTDPDGCANCGRSARTAKRTGLCSRCRDAQKYWSQTCAGSADAEPRISAAMRDVRLSTYI